MFVFSFSWRSRRCEDLSTGKGDFCDFHLNESGATNDHTSHFAMIGGLLQEKIVPIGPYV